MTKLYEIANEYAQLCSEDMPADMIADTLDGIEGEFSDKAEQLLAIVKNETALSKALKEESKSLSERAKAAENRAENIKQYIAKSLATMDKTKYTAGIHTITVRKPSQTVHIDNADLLPDSYLEFVTTTKIDKNLIKEKLKLGEEVPGASIQQGKSSLIIK